MADSTSKPRTKSELRKLFRRNGYVRWQNSSRLRNDKNKYKKGDEVRLIVRTQQELARVRRLLKSSGFECGKPFSKARQMAIPIYGRDQVAQFLEFIGVKPD